MTQTKKALAAAKEDPAVRKLVAELQSGTPDQKTERNRMLADKLMTRIKGDPVTKALASALSGTRDPAVIAGIMAMPEVRQSLNEVVIGTMTDLGLSTAEATKVASEIAPKIMKPWIGIAKNVMTDPVAQARLFDKLGGMKQHANTAMTKSKVIGEAFLDRNEMHLETIAREKDPDLKDPRAQIQFAALLKDPAVKGLVDAFKADTQTKK